MTLQEFHHGLRILLNIDRPEFVKAVADAQADLPAGFPRDDGAVMWPTFRDDPFMWFIRAPTAQAVELWKIVEGRLGA